MKLYIIFSLEVSFSLVCQVLCIWLLKFQAHDVICSALSCFRFTFSIRTLETNRICSQITVKCVQLSS